MVTESGRSGRSPSVVVIGGGGAFGGFLRSEVLPRLGVPGAISIERETPLEQRAAAVAGARHIVLCVPLSHYPAAAADLVRERGRAGGGAATLWLLPSVQHPTWEAVTEALNEVASGGITAVLAHPMYGPMGFASTEPEARTFRNILTAVHAPSVRGAAMVTRTAAAFERRLGITTVRTFTPAEHDRVTAASQGLSYCFARALYQDPRLDREAEQRLPDLHAALRTDRALIEDFLRANRFSPAVAERFEDERVRGGRAGLDGLLAAFAAVDGSLNPGGSPIPTKWYERLRRAVDHPAA